MPLVLITVSVNFLCLPPSFAVVVGLFEEDVNVTGIVATVFACFDCGYNRVTHRKGLESLTESKQLGGIRNA